MGLPEYHPEWDIEGVKCGRCGGMFSEDFFESSFHELKDGTLVCPECFKEWRELMGDRVHGLHHADIEISKDVRITITPGSFMLSLPTHNIVTSLESKHAEEIMNALDSGDYRYKETRWENEVQNS